MTSGDPEGQKPSEPSFQGDLEALRELQRLLDEAYEHYFANSDGYCKSSEGYIGLDLNNYFERRDGEPLRIKGVEVYSYVLGPSRRHTFPTIAAALDTVRRWHAEEMSCDYSEEDW
ncbi:hypothetical protein [Streptomyces sp. MP131-18]|uniref:hypothetical protein n=1 Tax=Streptomyces sp. MP131-18 TaxID=1857892 RepID=UPI00097C49A7|nr:hypothetical protein [Streptomyces sp. MP131-18]ONK10356.1 hypothetical protein STBA_10780 [Streptomyces sp. MP131-18]